MNWQQADTSSELLRAFGELLPAPAPLSAGTESFIIYLPPQYV